MNQGTVSALVGNDLRQLLRTPQVLVFSVALPLMLWPLMMWLSSLSVERQVERMEERTYLYAVAPGIDAETAGFIERALAEPGDDSLRLERTDSPADPVAALAAGELQVHVGAVLLEPAAPSDEDASADSDGDGGADGANDAGQTGDTASDGATADAIRSATRSDAEADAANIDASATDPDERGDPPPQIVLSHRGDINASSTAERALSSALRSARLDIRAERLDRAGLRLPAGGLLPLATVDAATDAQSAGLALGRFLSALLVMMMIGGGSIVAMDSLAGEKERGTIETLLTTAASRIEIVTAKNVSILLVAMAVTALQLANLVVWMRLDVIPVPTAFQLQVSPMTGALLLVLYLPIAVLISSTLLFVSGRSKTVREAQLLLFPVAIVTLALAATPVLPGLDLRGPAVLVPIANLCIAVKQVLTGTFDWPFLALAWAVTSGAAAMIARASARALSAEKLVTASDLDGADLRGGPEIFPRRVVRWFAGLWALLLVWQINAGAGIDGRLVIAINMALMGAAAWLLVRRYRLPARTALSLRLPAPATWLGVLIAAPAGLVLANGMVRLTSLVMPIPEELVEAMAESFGADLPLWQMLFFFAVLPGLLEELAFRGVLLHGLRSRLQGAPLVMVAGLAFGLFHVELFRIPPTTLLGVMLVLVVLRTGSIYPAMAWHALHNALALGSGRLDQAALAEQPAWWHYVAAIFGLLIAFRLMGRRSGSKPG